ncbi:type II toxin-antitoxin system VapC family toxin [Polymorphobacter fuscus]|uniref:Ribonuclease VapC n=1 Tax=Sandarakinorhabdus fusca TaxID=1439888 RepID=A0A7C9GNB9_9SPHN|nr:type II toxin-antitoxin system VapC family toxin [Polymorphobacter fuscus]KAB7647423.1 type II toxin-antitoxin system VapC family toxin [Polymorphobacter fuscus]MQT16672.1 PIN domain-containing protein [Polymorphobacter fuscus]NJC09343.1 ribonuclease VapC [Polymorphobacter fuscus]
MTVRLIVDTSALVAIIKAEDGDAMMQAALVDEPAGLPAPAFVELNRVMATIGNRPDARVQALVEAFGLQILPFGPEDAAAAVVANEVFGSGNGRAGPLNMLDLMVYGVARATGLPILCTGKDFAATDADLHPASRRF